MRRRTISARWILDALAVLLVGLALACGGGDSAPPSENGADGGGGAALAPVQLQLNWKPEPQFGGFYAAQVIGAYAKQGLQVEIRPGGASAPTVDMLGAGTVEFAVVSGDEIVRARANGNAIVGLFAAYQTNPQGIMTRAARGFTTIADIFSHPAPWRSSAACPTRASWRRSTASTSCASCRRRSATSASTAPIPSTRCSASSPRSRSRPRRSASRRRPS